MQGIYMILNEKNGKCYVGQSINIEKRWEDHKHTSTSKKSGAYNYHLYRSIRKHGLDWFSLHVLEVVEVEDDLTMREQFWYDVLKPEFNNIAPQRHTVVRRQPVYKINKETMTIEQEYEGIRAAARDTNVPRGNIIAVCKGNKVSAGGCYWCYTEDFVDWEPKIDKRSLRKVNRDKLGRFS